MLDNNLLCCATEDFARELWLSGVLFAFAYCDIWVLQLFKAIKDEGGKANGNKHKGVAELNA